MFLLDTSALYAERDQQIIEIPIIEDAYAKEYWPSTKTYTYPHLSLGYSTKYPEKRTELYFNLDMSEILELEFSSVDINAVTLHLTQFIAMGSNDFEVKIIDVPDPIDLSTLNWKVKPDEGSLQKDFLMTLSDIYREVPITEHVLKAIEEERDITGILIKMLDDTLPGALYYSSRCQNGTYYQPQCVEGMEPRVELKLISPPDQITNVSYNETVVDELSDTIKWESEEGYFCSVSVQSDSYKTTSTWSQIPMFELTVPEVGAYSFSISCKRDPGSKFVTTSEHYLVSFTESEGQSTEEERESSEEVPTVENKLPTKMDSVLQSPLFNGNKLPAPNLLRSPVVNEDSLGKDLFETDIDKDRNFGSKNLPLCTELSTNSKIACEDFEVNLKVDHCTDKSGCKFRLDYTHRVVLKRQKPLCKLFPFLSRKNCFEYEIEPVLLKPRASLNGKVIGSRFNGINLHIDQFVASEPGEIDLNLGFYLPNNSKQAIRTETRRISYLLEPENKKIYLFPFKEVAGVTQWHGYTEYDSPHTGIDFGVVNEEIHAIADGTIHSLGYDNYFGECNSGGYYINLRHSDGRHSIYLHLQKKAFELSDLNKGDQVVEGQLLGVSGNSGAYNCQPLGYHLHAEIRDNKSQSSHTDPVPLIMYNWSTVETLGADRYPGRLTGDNPHPTY